MKRRRCERKRKRWSEKLEAFCVEEEERRGEFFMRGKRDGKKEEESDDN